MSNTWKEIVDSRIDELKQRKDLVIKDKYIFRMMDVLGQIMTDDMPAPDVVPTYEGGVQFEWHRNGIDIEIEIHEKEYLFFEDDANSIDAILDIEVAKSCLKLLIDNPDELAELKSEISLINFKIELLMNKMAEQERRHLIKCETCDVVRLPPVVYELTD